MGVIAFLAVINPATAQAETPILTAPEAAEKVIAGEMILLDIRSPEEWQDTGLAEGAWPVSMHTPDFPQQLQALLSRYQPQQIGLICATGGRTAYVTEILEKNGISGVTDVSEGMFGNGTGQGWIARGLPIVPLDVAQSHFEAAQDEWDEN